MDGDVNTIGKQIFKYDWLYLNFKSQQGCSLKISVNFRIIKLIEIRTNNTSKSNHFKDTVLSIMHDEKYIK